MKTYSMDPRERVVAACDARDGTRERIASRSSASISWIRDLLRRRRETGSIAPKPHGGGRAPAFDAPGPERPRGGGPGRRRRDPGGVGPGRRGDVRPLGRASGPEAPGGHSRRRSRRAAEQDRPDLKAERHAWREEFAAIDPSRLVFVDESGASTAMDRTHGRSASGKRVDGPVPHGHRKITTLTAAVRLDGSPGRGCGGRGPGRSLR